MSTSLRRAAVVGFGLLLSVGSAGADRRLSLSVTPSVTTAPATLTVTATIPRDPENRILEIGADSGAFYRSSLVQLEGERAPKVSQVQLKNLPGGEYEVIAVLLDRAGRRTIARTTVFVLSAPGAR